MDGNDVLKVYEVSQKAVVRCRSGNGPVFLEFMTYRYRGHVGPDDNIQGLHTDIRPQEEIELWREKDPIVRLERYLVTERVLDEQELQLIRNEIAKEVQEAKVYAETSPYPKPEEIGSYVFA